MEAKIVTLNNRISMMLMNGFIMVKYIHYCNAKVLEHHPELELKLNVLMGRSAFLNKSPLRNYWSSLRQELIRYGLTINIDDCCLTSKGDRAAFARLILSIKEWEAREGLTNAWKSILNEKGQSIYKVPEN